MLRKKRRGTRHSVEPTDDKVNEDEEEDETGSDSEVRVERRTHERDVSVTQRRDWRGISRDRRKRDEHHEGGVGVGSPLDRRRNSDSRREEKIHGGGRKISDMIVHNSDSDRNDNTWHHRTEREERNERSWERSEREGHSASTSWGEKERERENFHHRNSWERSSGEEGGGGGGGGSLKEEIERERRGGGGRMHEDVYHEHNHHNYNNHSHNHHSYDNNSHHYTNNNIHSNNAHHVHHIRSLHGSTEHMYTEDEERHARQQQQEEEEEFYQRNRRRREEEEEDSCGIEREERRMLIPADVTDEEFPPPVIFRTPQQRYAIPPRTRTLSQGSVGNSGEEGRNNNNDNDNSNNNSQHNSPSFFLSPDGGDADVTDEEQQRDRTPESERRNKEEVTEVSMDDGDDGDRDDGETGPAWRRKDIHRGKTASEGKTVGGYNSGSGYECDSASEAGEEARLLETSITINEEHPAHPSRKDRELYNSSSSGSEVDEVGEGESEEKRSPFLRPEEGEEEEVEQEPTLMEALIDIIASSDNDVNLRRVPTVESQDMTSDARGEFVNKNRHHHHRNDPFIHPRTLNSGKKRKGRQQRSNEVPRPLPRDSYSKNLAVRRGHGPKPASSDENPPMARLSGVCRCKEYDLKRAMVSLQSHTTFPLYQVRQYPDVIAMKHRQINRCIFIFSYGVVVFFNIKKDNEAMFLNVLRPFEMEPLLETYRDDELEYCPSLNGNFQITNNVVHLQTESLAEKLSVAFALAQCVKLMEFEGRIEKVIESNKHLAEGMSQYGGIALSGHAITQKLGELYNERSAVNVYFDLMDTPSHFWEDDTYLPLYQRLVQYLELANRLGVLNKRLDILSELLRMVSGHLHTSHKSRLEWILIWLIGFHVFFGLVWEMLSKDILQIPGVLYAPYA